MDLLLWMVFGGLIGWIAAILVSSNNKNLSIIPVCAGVAGAVIGGILSRITMAEATGEHAATSFFVSIIGAIMLTTVMTFVVDRTSRK